VTRDAVALADAEASSPALAAVWGLVRSAQAEHPDRILLVDTDADVDLDADADGTESRLTAAVTAAIDAARHNSLSARDGTRAPPGAGRGP